MDKLHYEQMISNLKVLMEQEDIRDKKIYLFGHCNATETLADLLEEKALSVKAILDNNAEKWGKCYHSVKICAPLEILKEDAESSIVLIAARAYASMANQLNRMGYRGRIRKLVDYNSFAEYSFSEEVILRMKQRLNRGCELLDKFNGQYGGTFKIFCPFSALGDIYIMLSYLPYFLKAQGIFECVIFVTGNSCAKVVKLFGAYVVEVLSQKDMDELLQAVIYTKDANSFIAHQDRPYVINLHKALYLKCIPLEEIYCCGVFGLPRETVPIEASEFTVYPDIAAVPRNKSVILSPYAKSVTALPDWVWEKIVSYYTRKGFQCFTNVVGDEVPLKGTFPISPMISEMKSVVERAGIFIGIRSGLCDVIRAVNAKKIALYPDYNYSDTKWKAIDMYSLAGWENIVVKDELE